MELTNRLRQVSTVALFIAIVIVVDQTLDVVISAAPSAKPSDVFWRFGAFGLIAGKLPFLLIADLLLVMVAAANGSRIWLRLLGSLNILMAALLAAVMLGFALDALQVRRSVRPEVVATFLYSMLRAGVTAILSLGTLVTLGWGSWRAAGRRAAERPDLLLVRRTEAES